ncbi:hypothetical protein SANTM175S_09975 [Streptomyces antimycoticus]
MTEKLQKTAITPATHTTPPAKFSHGVKKGNVLQVAGQVGFGPAVPGQAPTPVGPTLREQTLQTLRNVQAVLGGFSAARSCWEARHDRVRVYLDRHAATSAESQRDLQRVLRRPQGGPGALVRRSTSASPPVCSSRSTPSPSWADPESHRGGRERLLLPPARGSDP